MLKRPIAFVTEHLTSSPSPEPSRLCRGRICEIGRSGEIVVMGVVDRPLACDLLHTGDGHSLAVGDEVLVHVPGAEGGAPIVLGRVGPATAPARPAHVLIEASEALTLKCGDASIDLRADGKVLIKGDDVLVRAKSTKRIRAGTVSIN